MPALSFCTASPHFFLPSLSLPLLSPFPPCKLFLFYLFPVENSQSRGQTLRESTLKVFRNWSSSTYPRERPRTPQRGLTWIIRRRGNSIIFLFISLFLPQSPSLSQLSLSASFTLPLPHPLSSPHPLLPLLLSLSRGLLEVWRMLLHKTEELARARQNVSEMLSQISDDMRQQKRTKKQTYKRVRG